MFLQYKVNALKRISVGIAFFVLFLGLAALAQWFIQSNPIITLTDGLRMKVNTALMVILSGFSIVLLYHGLALPARVLIICILTLSSLTLFEHVWNIDLGIDNWVYTSTPLGTETDW
ncbi:MAG: hypothetical protein EOP43_03060, partial [Sphingobacteriaceae bacterium]